MDLASILSALLETKIIAIIRLHSSKSVYKAALALAKGGIKAIEVTMGTPNALGEIEKIAHHEHILAGAGSVTTPQMVIDAVQAGAQYIVTPATNPDIIQQAHRLNKPVLSGALTPTEIIQAYEWGADIIKLFPANIFGIPYLKAVRAPLPHIPIMPTGGVTIENAAAWIQHGAVCLGVGSTLVSQQIVDETDFDTITLNAIKMRTAIQ
ncbi:MAG: bifunctional 4-hydroxy-2-oxoglutarate aldolase/2-dehydro-3-deoxy-phosphogluconate aldolase [Saprospiraceae bacterium]|nr:bifunctional 4-hydroxy-2-oxoglutarate aldolase/2-dehydro-3-deoxy-phosphogluconate aldolase [Saprospiraceae bacterium]